MNKLNSISVRKSNNYLSLCLNRLRKKEKNQKLNSVEAFIKRESEKHVGAMYREVG